MLLNTWLWSVKGDKHFEKFSNMMGRGIGPFLIKRFNLFGKMVVKKAVADKTNFTKAIHKHYYKHLATPKQRKGSYVFPREITGSSDWLDTLWNKVSTITSIPTVIVWGMKDIAFKEKELERWMRTFRWPNVIKLDHVGHYPQEEAPQVIITELKKEK